MSQQIQTFGSVKYRTARSYDVPIRWTGLRNVHKHAYVWEHADSITGEALKGLGYPIFNSNGEIVNFLKMSFSGPLFFKDSYIEESVVPGLPIANCHARFGKPTNVILVTVDCLTAMVLHLATGLGTVAALYPGNLKAISVYLRSRYPAKSIKICVNGDGGDEDSPLLREAHDAAYAIRTKVFASGSMTFFALRRKGGLDHVQEALDGKGAVSLWDMSRGNKNLKISGSPTAWPNRIEGENLLDNLIHQVKRHIAIPDDLALIVVLWIMHTYGIDSTRFSPLLAIMSPEYIDGTGNLLEVLRRLCRAAYRTSEITSIQLQELADGHRPTILFDDGDAIFKSPVFNKILNASHDRNTGGVTISDRNQGISIQNTFFAKATMSNIGLPQSIFGIAIPILLQRGQPDEHFAEIQAFDLDANDEFHALQAQIVRWWQDHSAEVGNWPPATIDLGSDQLNSTYRPLLAIANTIGQDVQNRTVRAVKTILARENTKSDGVYLLENISELSTDMPDGKMHSIVLTDRLTERVDWRWAAYLNGKPLDQTALAALLAPYGVHTRPVRTNGTVKRGYYFSDFSEAFKRYVRQQSPEETALYDSLGIEAKSSPFLMV